MAEGLSIPSDILLFTVALLQESTLQIFSNQTLKNPNPPKKVNIQEQLVDKLFPELRVLNKNYQLFYPWGRLLCEFNLEAEFSNPSQVNCPTFPEVLHNTKHICSEYVRPLTVKVGGTCRTGLL